MLHPLSYGDDMSNKDYQRLVKDLCHVVGLADPAHIIESQHLSIDEQTIALVYDESVSADTLFVYFDLGEIPEARRAGLHSAMLQANLRPDHDATGHFGVHHKTGHAVFHMRIRGFEQLSGEALAAFLSAHAQGLRGWEERLSDLLPQPPTARRRLPRSV
jgi:hypothetical protein